MPNGHDAEGRKQNRVVVELSKGRQPPQNCFLQCTKMDMTSVLLLFCVFVVMLYVNDACDNDVMVSGAYHREETIFRLRGFVVFGNRGYLVVKALLANVMACILRFTAKSKSRCLKWKKGSFLSNNRFQAVAEW